MEPYGRRNQRMDERKTLAFQAQQESEQRKAKRAWWNNPQNLDGWLHQTLGAAYDAKECRYLGSYKPSGYSAVGMGASAPTYIPGWWRPRLCLADALGRQCEGKCPKFRDRHVWSGAPSWLRFATKWFDYIPGWRDYAECYGGYRAREVPLWEQVVDVLAGSLYGLGIIVVIGSMVGVPLMLLLRAMVGKP